MSTLQFSSAVNSCSFNSRMSPHVNGSGISGVGQSALRFAGIGTAGTGTYFVFVHSQAVSRARRNRLNRLNSALIDLIRLPDNDDTRRSFLTVLSLFICGYLINLIEKGYSVNNVVCDGCRLLCLLFSFFSAGGVWAQITPGTNHSQQDSDDYCRQLGFAHIIPSRQSCFSAARRVTSREGFSHRRIPIGGTDCRR